MTAPLSPPPVPGGARNELPAYVANGVMGLRVREMPLAAGLTLVSGYSGLHPQRQIEAIAAAPYPIAADICISGVWLSDAGHAVTVIDQRYDFETGELTSRLEFEAGGRRACLEVLVFCSRDEPSLVCQEISLRLDSDGDLALKALLDGRHVDGRVLRWLRDTPGDEAPCCDGAALWESAGALSTCGMAYISELVGADAQAERPALENRTLSTSYAFAAKGGQTYRLRQIVSLVPKVTHAEPDFQAVRQVALARKRGFDALRSGQSSGLGRIMEGTYPAAWRRPAVAGARRRRSLLSVQLDPRRFALIDVDLRPRDLA